MASTQVVTVERVDARTTRAGKRFWVVRTDAGDFYCWDAALAEQISPGRMSLTINGDSDQYPKVIAAEPISTSAASTPPAASERERRMLRMSALRAAAEVLHGTGVPAGELVAYAEALLAWLEA